MICSPEHNGCFCYSAIVPSVNSSPFNPEYMKLLKNLILPCTFSIVSQDSY